MRLLNPWGLAWLALIVPLVLLYLLRLRRHELTVSSVLFWERAIQDMQANTPLQRLQHNLLLYLQIAVVVVAALALARPAFPTRSIGSRAAVAVLDTSASMAVASGAATRFELARERVRRLIDQLGRGDELMLVVATDRAAVLHPWSSDRRSLRRALAVAAPTDLPSDLRDAVTLAVSAARGRSEAKVYLFSDGAAPPLGELDVSLAGVELVPVGRPVDNVGITAIDVRRDFGLPPRTELLVELQAAGPSRGPRTVELEFRAGGRLYDLRRTTVTPGSPKRLLIDDLPLGAGLLEVRLSGTDALAADDRAFVNLGSQRRTEVLLVGEPDLFLQKALAVDSSLEVVRTTAESFAAMRREGRLGADSVAVFCGTAPGGPVPVPALFLTAAGGAAPIEVSGGEVELPAVTDWSPQHPVTTFVDFGTVAIAKASAGRLRPWARAVVESGSLPLVAVGEEQGLRRVAVGFEFVDSDLPLRPGFPIFIANTLRWLASGPSTAGAPAIRTGRPIALLLGGAGVAEVTRPDGTRRRVAVQEGRLSYGETDRVGIYRVHTNELEQSFAASLLSASESDPTPRTVLAAGRAAIRAAATPARRDRETWRLWASLALGLLLLEWWWYHRRGR